MSETDPSTLESAEKKITRLCAVIAEKDATIERLQLVVSHWEQWRDVLMALPDKILASQRAVKGAADALGRSIEAMKR